MNDNPINDPQANIGRQFASPIKKGSDRTTRAIERQRTKKNLEVQSLLTASSSASAVQVPVESCVLVVTLSMIICQQLPNRLLKQWKETKSQ